MAWNREAAIWKSYRDSFFGEISKQELKEAIK